MCLAMAGFALNDAAMKFVLAEMPLMPAIAVRGVIVSALLAVLCAVSGAFAWRPPKGDGPILTLRVMAEVATTLLFLSALMRVDLATATAVLQASPLAVTLAAAVWLREPVGWRRAGALVVGFGGVMLIIRPGSAAFEPAMLLAVAAVGTIVLRDLSTRRLSRGAPSMLVALLTVLAVTFVGAVGSVGYNWPAQSTEVWLALPLAALFMLVAGVYSVRAMRVGEVGFIAPFRYTILIWAMIGGIILFGELPDTLTLVGATLIVGSGIYTLWREQRVARSARAGSR